MALNFPDSPTLNEVYTDNTSGFSYQWDGSVWQSYSASTTSNITELDDISGSFDGSTTIFPLTVGGQSVSPASSNQLIISVGGVMQNPTDDFYISGGSNIVFTTAPASGLTFFGTLLGTAVPIGVSTIGDVYNRQTYSVTGVQTNFTFTSGYTIGYLDVFRNGARLIAGDDFTATTGSTFDLDPPAQNGDNVEAIGYKVSTIAITEGNLTNLYVSQNATVVGILTVGTSSLTLNGDTNQINGVTVSSGIVTASSFVGELTGTATGLSGSPDVTVGILTASVISAGSTTGTGGQVLQSTGAGVTWTDAASGGISVTDSNVIGYGPTGLRNDGANGRLDVFGQGNFQVFTSPGTFNVSPGISSIRVRVVGAGGNGGVGNAPRLSGGGGGGGGYAHKVITSFTAPRSYTVTIGTAPGGTTSFGSEVSATGGSNGTDAPPTVSGTGGTGGTGSSGDVNFIGATGSNGSSGPGQAGGKGGAAATQLGNGSGNSVPGLPSVNVSSVHGPSGVVQTAFRDTFISRFPFDIFNGFNGANGGGDGVASSSPNALLSGFNGGSGGKCPNANIPIGGGIGGVAGGGGGGANGGGTIGGNGGAGGLGAGGGGGGGNNTSPGTAGTGGSGGAGIVIVEW